MFREKKSKTHLWASILLFVDFECLGSGLDSIQEPTDSYVHLAGSSPNQSGISIDHFFYQPYLILALVIFSCLLLYSWYYHYTAHQKLKDLNKELEEYIESNIKLEQFAHIASHDLKSPLRTVISYTGLIRKKMAGKTSPDIDRYLDYIKNGAVQMDNLTSDLLDFAKVNSMVLNTEKFKTREMIQDVLNLLEYSIKTKKAQIIICNLPEYVYGDRQKLQRVVHNLLSNSLKFVHKERIPEIEISCRQRLDDFVFSISDNGIGIDKKFQKNIFSSFTKLNNETDYQGTGLGLTMARKIIELHGGNIKLKSYTDHGSTFSFSVPRKGEEIAYDAKRELVA